MPKRPGNQDIKEADLRYWKLLGAFIDCLQELTGQEPIHPTFEDPRRRLDIIEYLGLFLFGLFNPTVRTMRGLCEISRLTRVQKEVCKSVSLGSFSETQHAIDPSFLAKVVSKLAQKVPPGEQTRKFGNWQWMARDGSIFGALPRMHWALYGGGRAGCVNHAARLHLSLDISNGAPQAAAIRPGKKCERAVWREHWEPGQAYVCDCYFSEDYSVFDQLNELKSVYVLRMREQAVINIEEELPISQEDAKAGVIRHAWARLGSRKKSARVRIVWVRSASAREIILVTNLTVEELSAGLVADLYKCRWEIELFFRWIKCILNCRHWLAESSEGAAIQIYLALIAALLTVIALGGRPNKRMMELLQFYFQGWATDEELANGIRREREKMERRRNKK